MSAPPLGDARIHKSSGSGLPGGGIFKSLRRHRIFTGEHRIRSLRKEQASVRCQC
jgi:hypothetical protein